jgi:hypothetical protein
MQKWTVVAVYADNCQVFTQVYEGVTWQQAASQLPPGLLIAAVICGVHHCDGPESLTPADEIEMTVKP